MQQISYTSLRQNLSSVLNEIEDNQTIYCVTRQTHPDVIMVSRKNYESLIETLHLLSSSKNADKLYESINQDRNGEYESVTLESEKNVG